MAKIKRCKQCGESKDINEFRDYYNRGEGKYTTCKMCERINSRYKYLRGKETLTQDETTERDAILLLYSTQVQAGLKPPARRAGSVSLDYLQEQIYKTAQIIPSVAVPDAAPFELTRWLTESLDNTTPERNDAVYNKLRDTYRPIIGIDPVSQLPVYDNKYADILDEISKRFDAYEDMRYNEMLDKFAPKDGE